KIAAALTSAGIGIGVGGYRDKRAFPVFHGDADADARAGQGCGVAVKYRESSLVTVSAAIAGVIGGYASQLLAGTFFVDGNVIFSGPGEPLGAFVAAFVGITFGHLISGKTKLD